MKTCLWKSRIFFCELATQSQHSGQITQTRLYLKRALRMHPGCVRANHLMGQLAWQAGRHHAALSHWQQIVRDDPGYLPEVWPDLFNACQTLNKLAELSHLLGEITDTMPASGIPLYQAKILQQCEDQATATDFLLNVIRHSPTIPAITAYLQQHTGQMQTIDRDTLSAALQQIQQEQTEYQCRQCGFQSRALHWQCPRCSAWGSVRHQ